MSVECFHWPKIFRTSVKFSSSKIGYVFENNTLHIPHDEEIVVSTLEKFLYILVGDEILPLKPWFSDHIQENCQRKKEFTNITVVVVVIFPPTLLFI